MIKRWTPTTGDKMKKEIERKFLVRNDSWRSSDKGTMYRQGYLNTSKERTVRVRLEEDIAFIVIKGPTVGATRDEYMYEIPVDDCNAILDTLVEKPIIEKRRFKIQFGGLIWEVDEFLGENEGLILAEVELESETQNFKKPDWVGKEVTNDSRYYNSNLIKHPFKEFNGRDM